MAAKAPHGLPQIEQQPGQGMASGRVPKVILCYEAGYDGFWLARFIAGTHAPAKPSALSL